MMICDIFAVGNDAMTAMHLFNESLHLNPCANLDGEIHAKFILAVRENDYFDADEWRTLAAHVADDFGALGVSTCFNFLQSDPQSSEQPVRIEQVRGIVGSVNIHWMLFSIYEAADDRNQAW
jgi:hypothetical protein